MDAMEFFQQSAGRWRSQRTTHHLAFKRAEAGESEIKVEALTATDPDIITLCQQHDIDPQLAVGGCRVRWEGSMGWDREGENHEGSTVFVLVPDDGNPRKGRLIRERGYAEIVPVVGHYEMDDEDGLVLITEYDTMSSVERFWFANPDMRLRSSTVKRFGGFSTASFCTEVRVTDSTNPIAAEVIPGSQDVATAKPYLSALGW